MTTGPDMRAPSWSQLLELVRTSARLGPADDPDRVTRVTIAALVDRVPESVTRAMSARLPRDVATHLRPTTDRDIRYADDLVAEVADAAGLDALRAARVARLVLEVMDQASSGALATKVAGTLPEDVRDLVRSTRRH